MAEAYLVRLAREELVYCLHALSIPTIPGLVGPPLGDLDSDQQGLVLSVADRTLRARGASQWQGEDQRTLEPMLSSMLRRYSQPQTTVIMEFTRPGVPLANSIMVFAGALAIEQWQGEAGVHQFLALGTAPDVLALYERHLDLLADVPAPSGGATLSAAALRSVRRGEHGIGSLPADLAAALAQPTFALEGAVWQGMPDGAAAQMMGLVAGKAGIWWHSGVDPVTFTPTTRAGALQHIAEVLQPALAMLAQSATP